MGSSKLACASVAAVVVILAVLGGQGVDASRLRGTGRVLLQANTTMLAVESLNATNSSTALASNVSTIFAPTDAAFEELAMLLNLTSPMDLFNATYNATAANITALHVIPGAALLSTNLTAGMSIIAPSLLGPELEVGMLPNGTVYVTVVGGPNVATVVTPDVPFNGSIVHVIDKVLLPPANVTASWGLPPLA